jgi:uncharacterized RDD family membrane protein YckC
MNWYYEDRGNRVGPLDEAAFADRVNSAAVTGATLVWTEGMANWLPLSQAAPQLATISGAAQPSVGGYAVPPEQKDYYVQQLREGVNVQGAGFGQVVYGGFWWRFLAYFIDSLAVGVVGFVVQMILQVVLVSAVGSGQENGAVIVIGTVIIMLISFALNMAYFAVFNKLYSATPGKMAVGLTVVNAELKPLTWGKAWFRAFGTVFVMPLLLLLTAGLIVGIFAGVGFLSGGGMEAFKSGEPPLLFMLLIGVGGFLGLLVGYWPYYMAGRDSEKRALHDRMCGTRVLKNR